MPNNRDLKLDDYNISQYAYRELKYFCLQYPEKKKKIADLHNPLRGIAYDGMPHGTSPGEPTANAAVRAAQLSRDCEMIEQTAIEALPDAYTELIKSVTDDTYGFKPSKLVRWADFKNGRRYFFYLLARKKKII